MEKAYTSSAHTSVAIKRAESKKMQQNCVGYQKGSDGASHSLFIRAIYGAP